DRSGDLRRGFFAASVGGGIGELAAGAPRDKAQPDDCAPTRVKFVVPPLGGCVLRRCFTNSLEPFFIFGNSSFTAEARSSQRSRGERKREVSEISLRSLTARCVCGGELIFAIMAGFYFQRPSAGMV